MSNGTFDPRIVEIWAPGHFASGYAVADDLLLTTRHGLESRDQCRIRPLGDTVWRDAFVVWRGKAMVDAALLRVDTTLWSNSAVLDRTRWAELRESGVTCTAAGFPRVESQQEARGTRRIPVTVTASVDPTPAAKINRYGVSIEAPLLITSDKSAWQGMSGAVLLSQPLRQVVGVVSGSLVGYQGTKLEAVPALALLRDKRFAELVSASTSDLEIPGDPDTVGLLERVVDSAATPLPDGAADWQLLLPEHTVVPFVGRREVRTRLRQWCTRTAERFGIGVVTGEGGAGKTRLAVQLCADLAARGWDTGFYRGHEFSPDRVWDARRPTLVVIDDPARLISDVERLVQTLRKRRFGPPVRLLLLARADGTADGYSETVWWRRISASTGATDDRAGSGREPTAVALDHQPLTTEQLNIHYAAALDAFGGGDDPPVSFDDTESWRQPLGAHFAALLAARGNNVDTLSGVRRAFFEREVRLWQGLWQGHWDAPPNAFQQRCIVECVAAVALTNPAPEAVESLLECVPTKGPVSSAQLWAWLREVFPGQTERLVFGPDLLTGQLLEAVTELPNLVLALAASPACHVEQQAAMIESLLLAAEHDGPRRALFALVSTRFAELCQTAFDHEDTLLADPLDQAVNLLYGDPQHRKRLRELASGLPLASLPHRHHGLLATLIALTTDRLRGLDTEVSPLRLAGALIDLAAHAAATGRDDEAVSHLEEALSRFRDENVENPDSALARQNLAVCRYRNGDHADALVHAVAAVEIYDDLSETTEGVSPWLAEALLTTALCAAHVGDLETAAEALHYATEIGAQTQGGAEIAVALTNLRQFLPELPPIDTSDVVPQLVHDRQQTPAAQSARLYEVGVLIATELSSRCPDVVPPAQFDAWSAIADNLVTKARHDATLRVMKPLLISLTQSANQSHVDQGVSIAQLLPLLAVDAPARLAAVADDLREPLSRDPRARFCLAFVDIAYATAMSLQEEPELAVPPFERAVAVLSESDEYDYDRGNALQGLVFAYRGVGNLERALEACQTSVSLLRALSQEDGDYLPDLVEALSLLVLTRSAAGLDVSGITGELIGLQTTLGTTPGADLTRLLFIEHRLRTMGAVALPDAEQELRRLEDKVDEATGVLKREYVLLFAGAAALVARFRATVRGRDSAIVLIERAQRLVEQHHGDGPAANFTRVQILVARGYCHLGDGDVPAAVADFTRANDIEVDADRFPLITVQYEIRLGLMRAYLLSRRPHDAAEEARCALKLIDAMDPSIDVEQLRGNVMTILVEATGLSGNVSEAVAMADAVIAKLSPTNPTHQVPLANAHFAKANVYLVSEMPEPAFSASMEAAKLLRPISSRYPLLLALYLETAGNCADALNHPETKSLLWEGTSLMRKERESGALTPLPTGLFMPAHALATANRAGIHLQLEAPEDALLWLTESLAALVAACPLPEANPATVVLMTLLELFDTYLIDESGTEQERGEVSDLFRHIGADATTLLVVGGPNLDNVPGLSTRTGWRILSRMSETGRLPIDELNSYIDDLNDAFERLSDS